MKRHSMRTWGVAGAAVLVLTGVPAAIVTIAPSGEAHADVCASAGRRISVSGCANLSDVMAPYVPPPSYYAPLPEDYPPPLHRPRRRSAAAWATTAAGSAPAAAAKALSRRRWGISVSPPTISIDTRHARRSGIRRLSLLDRVETGGLDDKR